jgi:beta-phosphoglucomutase family hydrolase
MPEMTTWAVIFDFDGVIVDSAKAHAHAWQQVAKNRNLHLTYDEFLSGFGMKNERFISEVLGWTQDPTTIQAIIHEKELAFQKINQEHPVQFVQGLVAFVQELRNKKIPYAIGSSSILKNITIVLEKFPIQHAFPTIISGEHVVHGKPNPEIFLKAAHALHMKPEQCVVFEDALLGIEAANRAHMHSVAVTTSFDAHAFSGKADKIIASFQGLSVDDIEALFRTRK